MKRPYIISRANLKVNPTEDGLVCGLDMKQDIAGTVFDNKVAASVHIDTPVVVGNVIAFDAVVLAMQIQSDAGRAAFGELAALDDTILGAT